MSDERDKPKAKGRVVTMEQPTGPAHVSTRSVVMAKARKKVVKVQGILGRKITTRVWQRQEPPERPPSIGSMQPPGKK